MKKIIFNSLIASFIFIFWTIILWIVAYKVYAELSNVSSWNVLTAANYNDLINKINTLESSISTQNTTITSLQTTISSLNSIPSGSVVPFNLSNCPTGWSEYTALYWRFIRGIDKSWTNIDPNWQRTLWNIQIDAFQWHKHSWIWENWWPAWEFTPSAWFWIKYWDTWSPVSDWTNGTPRINNETRPKNIALLYCIKN